MTSYGKRPTRCPVRRMPAGYQCQRDAGHAGAHENANAATAWADEPYVSNNGIRPVSAPDLVEALEAFVRAVIADTHADSAVEDAITLMRARQTLLTTIVEREGA